MMPKIIAAPAAMAMGPFLARLDVIEDGSALAHARANSLVDKFPIGAFSPLAAHQASFAQRTKGATTAVSTAGRHAANKIGPLAILDFIVLENFSIKSIRLRRPLEIPFTDDP